MGFGTLTLIVLAGLAGPLLGGVRRLAAPIVVGEIAAGIAIGGTGAGWIDADEPTLVVLGQIGFAMLMLQAGMHVPLRSPALLRDTRRSLAAVAVAAALAVPSGMVAAAVADRGDWLLYTVLLSGGSAAVVLPVLIERRMMDTPEALTVVMQIAVADVLAIVALPLVLEPDTALRVALASLAVSAAAFAAFLVARRIDSGRVVRRLRRLSASRGWALDLRVALLVLFALCWVAVEGGTSILVAGFSAGLVVGALGGPARLSTQVVGVAQGFFIPLFFVLLGARIDLAALWNEPALLALVGVLVAANVAVHLAAAAATGQAPATGLLATAQMGLPAAVATLGLETGVLDAGHAAAVVAAGLCSLPVTALGAERLARRVRARPPAIAAP